MQLQNQLFQIKNRVHKPVMVNEVLNYLDVGPGKNFIDCTFGQGGHTVAILKKNAPRGKVLAFEWDPELYKIGKSLMREFIKKKRLFLVNESYTNLSSIVRKTNFENIDGVLFDLGISQWHFKQSKRGFSLYNDEPLDMRFNPKLQSLTAFEIINYWPKTKLIEIFRKYGEERFAEKIAQAIIIRRKTKKFKTSKELAEFIEKIVPSFYKRKKIHCATKIFQSLRIVINQELENFQRGLEEAAKVVRNRGRLVVISFHSLEDRIVKKYFKNLAKKGAAKILTKKPVRPSKVEIIQNPSARSAKLRAIIILK